MSGIKDTLTAQLGRISTPAKEVRDMLAVLADALMSGCYFGPSGAVYWVNGFGTNGNDSYTGRDVDHPKRTIGAALALCENGKNDHIFVIDYWQPADEVWPIQINKKLVHIVGLAQRNFPYPAIHPDEDKAAFAINESGSYSSIENLTIGGGSTSAGISLGAVTGINTKPEGVLIRNCVFGHNWFGTPDHGIDSVQYGSMGTRIEDCTFLGDLAGNIGALAENAIEFTTAAANNENLEILNCIFKGCAIGINLVKGPGAVIVGNKFTCVDAADGEAITLAATCLGSLISGNEAMKGPNAMVKNPFKDLGTNHWGLNYRQGLSIMPAIV